MLKTCCLFVPVFILGACSIQRPYHQRLNHIPIQGPNFGAEILFQGQEPAKPYFEVLELYVREKGKVSRRTIMKKLEMEAIKEGVDAVMQIEYWNGSEEKVNLLTMFIDVMDVDYETTYVNAPFTHMRGIGIKYLENIDYLDQQPEFEYVYKIDSATDFPEPLFKIEYNPTGQEHRIYPESLEGELIYDEYFQYYSDFHLLHQRERWFYTISNDRVKKRILYDLHGFVVKTCFLKYDAKGRLETLEIRNRLIGYDTINYHYNDQGNLAFRTVHSHDQVRIFDQYNYLNGKLSGREIKITLPDKKHYLLTTSIIYYDSEYLRDYYFQEYARTKNPAKSE